MVIAKIALLVVAAAAAYDSWRNRKKYAARERKRTAKGGLD